MISRNRKVLVSYNDVHSFDEKFMEQLTHSHGFTCYVKHEKNTTQDDYLDVEIIFGQPRREYLKKAMALRWVQLPSAGADNIADINLFASDKVILTNASGVYGKPIAEHVFAMILSFNRNLIQYERNRQKCKWAVIPQVRDLYRSTLCVIGLGDIGSEVAILGKAFGAKVIALKRTPGERPAYVDELYGMEELDRVLAQSDYLVLALPNTPETKGIMSAERIALLKPEAFIVNVGRGSAICQEALICALQEGRIAGAGLDVTVPEPLPSDSPLWKMPNVIITSHSSGTSPGNWSRYAALIQENFTRYIDGKQLANQVDFNLKY
ncbi:MAG: D-2-hydroxyacid dehydrogenase [Clostridiaceae bacterium]|nr:D-2-hydroxyacid dehydrogenase [Clostridiaceae bacterium]